MIKYTLFFLGLQLVNCGYVSKQNDRIGEISSKCEYDDDCTTPHAYCKNNRMCTCKNGYDFDQYSDTCFPTRLGLKCRDDYDCSALDNSKCVEMICQCTKGYVAPNEGTVCLQTSRLMGSCKDDQQCIVADENTHCNINEGRCECLPGHHPSSREQACIPTKRLREECESHSSCAATPEQDDKVDCRPDTDGRRKCLCSPGHGQVGNTCVKGAPDDGTTLMISTACLITAALVHIL